MDLILASNNPHKVEEIQTILAATSIKVKSLKDIGFHEDIVEDGLSLEANAWIKADAIYQLKGVNVVADDTGLEVDALGGRPGVHSARYAGEHRSSEDNMDKLIEELSDKDDRSAQFRTVMALYLDGERHEFEGIVRGHILNERQGQGGFGYDPIFVPEGYDDSFGVLAPEIKNKISHRGRATQQLVSFLLDSI